MKKAFYPGSFDPITYGHMDIIEQTLKIFDKVTVAILKNQKKNSSMFTMEERYNLIKMLYKGNPNVEIIFSEDNIAAVKLAKQNDCIALIRGLRNITDFADEKQLSDVNYTISHGEMITLSFFAKPNKLDISSSLVKNIFTIDEDISMFVPEIIENAMKNKLKEE